MGRETDVGPRGTRLGAAPPRLGALLSNAPLLRGQRHHTCQGRRRVPKGVRLSQSNRDATCRSREGREAGVTGVGGFRGGGRSGPCPAWRGREGLGQSDSRSIRHPGERRSRRQVPFQVALWEVSARRSFAPGPRGGQAWSHSRSPPLPRGRGRLAGPPPGGHWSLLVTVVIGAPGTTLGSECFSFKRPNSFSDDTRNSSPQRFIPFQTASLAFTWAPSGPPPTSGWPSRLRTPWRPTQGQ